MSCNVFLGASHAVFEHWIYLSSNTKSRYGKSVCEKLTWKICYLIYHAVIEHRAGTREDIAGDIDDYVDLKIIIFDQVIIASSLPFLFEIILGHLVIFSIYFIWWLSKRKAGESPRESEWVEWFVSFWVYVYTLVSCVHKVFYKPCWWEYMFEWTFVTENWWEITRDVWFVDDGISSRVCL